MNHSSFLTSFYSQSIVQILPPFTHLIPSHTSHTDFIHQVHLQLTNSRIFTTYIFWISEHSDRKHKPMTTLACSVTTMPASVTTTTIMPVRESLLPFRTISQLILTFPLFTAGLEQQQGDCRNHPSQRLSSCSNCSGLSGLSSFSNCWESPFSNCC